MQIEIDKFIIILHFCHNMYESSCRELEKSKVQFKYDSRRLTARATRVPFMIGQKLKIYSQIMGYLWVATQIKFKENNVPQLKKQKTCPFFLS